MGFQMANQWAETNTKFDTDMQKEKCVQPLLLFFTKVLLSEKEIANYSSDNESNKEKFGIIHYDTNERSLLIYDAFQSINKEMDTGEYVFPVYIWIYYLNLEVFNTSYKINSPGKLDEKISCQIDELFEKVLVSPQSSAPYFASVEFRQSKISNNSNSEKCKSKIPETNLNYRNYYCLDLNQTRLSFAIKEYFSKFNPDYQELVEPELKTQSQAAKFGKKGDLLINGHLLSRVYINVKANIVELKNSDNLSLINNIHLTSYGTQINLVLLLRKTILEIPFLVIVITSIAAFQISLGAEIELKIIWSIIKRPYPPIIGFLSQYLLMPLVYFNFLYKFVNFSDTTRKHKKANSLENPQIIFYFELDCTKPWGI